MRSEPLEAFFGRTQRHRRPHARGGRRLRLRLPPHAAPAARPDDDRRAADGAAARRARATNTASRRPSTRPRPRSRTSTWPRSRPMSPASSPSCSSHRLPGHVISRAELELISGEEETSGGQARFSSLYRVGLLGYVQHDRVRGEWRQRFLRPGEATLETNGVLPRATHYLVHPVLFDVIARHNTGLRAAHRPREHRRLRPALARVGAGRADPRRAPVVRAQGRRAGLRGADALRRSTARSGPRSRRRCGAGRRRRRSPRSVPATPS